MIFRFSAYGFLKNLRLFEPFLLLALLDRGYGFFEIGVLVAIREVSVNVLEIPSGALADALGRRRCMVVSMAAYVLSYIGLGAFDEFGLLAVAMLFYGVGDAFRSGTHKALIYAWLRQQGRTDERTRVYGYTRSWSKRGSALSAIVAGGLVATGVDYAWVFYASALPALLNLFNLATYPASLDDERKNSDWTATWTHLRDALGVVLRERRARRLVVGSLAFEGGYAVGKDYLQPVLQTIAVGWPVFLGLEAQSRTGVLVGLVSGALYFAASAASRRAHRVEERFGGDADRAACALARGQLALYLLVGVGLVFEIATLTVIGFVGLGIVQNLWRPIHVGRFDRDTAEQHAATTLSIESQAKALAAAIWAPTIGALVDWGTSGAVDATSPASLSTLWPVLLLGLPLILIVRTPRIGER